MSELQYSSAIKDLPFLYLETRKTALLLKDGKQPEEIVELSVSENIYQLEKEKRRKELPQKVLKRLESVNSDLIGVIAYGNDNDARLVTLLAILKTDRLFFEFMDEIYLEKYTARQLKITDSDFTFFFNNKIAQSDRVAGWQQTNLEKVKKTYIKILIEAGLVKKTSDVAEIVKPVCSKDTLTLLLNEDDEKYANAMLLIGA